MVPHTQTGRGRFYAQIGIDDHLAHYQGRYASKRYLRYSNWVWDHLLGNEVQYINHLTKSQILGLLEGVGFAIDDVETDARSDTPLEKVHSDYRWQAKRTSGQSGQCDGP
jgi:hypothetical protein